VKVASVDKRVTRVGMLIILRSLEESEVEEREMKFWKKLSDRLGWKLPLVLLLWVV